MSNVSVRDLTLSFGAVEVLKRLNVEVPEGEFLVLLGPSGCGKSTLLNCIAGLLDVTDGQIWIGGRNVTWEEPKDRGIGMVFQSYALYPQMSVRGNLSFGLKNQRLPKAEIEERVARAASILQIEPLLDRKPAALSGGQRQRVAIGRALVRDVDVFLFDEPLSNLDAKLRAELRVELKRLHRRLGRTTMIYVTHDQVEALTLADRIAIMKNGVIQQLATPKEIYNRPANLFVAGFIGSPAMNMFEGRIARDGGGVAADLGDIRVPLEHYPFGRAPEEGEPIVLGVRPEHIAPAPASAATVSAPVSLTEPMGSDTLAWFEMGDRLVSARLTPDEADALPSGAVPIAFDTGKLSVFSKASEERL